MCLASVPFAKPPLLSPEAVKEVSISPFKLTITEREEDKESKNEDSMNVDVKSDEVKEDKPHRAKRAKKELSTKEEEKEGKLGLVK